MRTPWRLLQDRLRSDPGNPFVTHVDGKGDTRIELSAQSLGNAAAKIGNALRDEFGLDPGDVVALDIPLHWQRAAWCAGIWTAGCVLDIDPAAVPSAALAVCDSSAAARAVATGVPRVAVSLHPLGLPISTPMPAGIDDATLLVRMQPDAYLFEPPSDDAVLLRSGDRSRPGLDVAEVLSLAGDRAREWGLAKGGRLLADATLGPLDAYLAAFAVPLVAGASVVLVSDVDDMQRVATQERVTASAR